MKLINKWKEYRFWRMVDGSDVEQMEKMLQMIMKKYEKLNPETEMLYATLPKYDLAERKRMLDAMCNFLMNQKTDSLG